MRSYSISRFSLIIGVVFFVFAGVSSLTSCGDNSIGEPGSAKFIEPQPSPTPEATPTPTVSPSPDPRRWRSILYPQNWQPEDTDGQGRFLHDFSYAGYHKSEKVLPTNPPGQIVNVTQSPYNADSSGVLDSTVAIQAAIDHVSSLGGGVVFLPQGTYKVKPQGANRYALWIGSSRVVLRGAGQGMTFLYNEETNMREKEVIRVAPSATLNDQWRWPQDGSGTWNLAQDVQSRDTKIYLHSVAGLNIGDWIVIKTETTDEWIADHHMTGLWDASLGGLVSYRKIIELNTSNKTITLDSPIRYPMHVRDQARVFYARPHIEEVGVESLSIGMKNVRSQDLKDNDYNKPGTVSYLVHQSHAVLFNFVLNGWIRNVSSYRPSENNEDFHILSNGLKLFMSHQVTIENCDMNKANYKGAGANGYLYIHQGSNNIIKNSRADEGRHNYTFSGLESQGNVILKSQALNSRLPTDFHMYLSAANLIDGMILDRDYIGAFYRDTATPKHGHATTQSVLWNIRGLNPHSISHRNLIETGQFGWGYVIGTSGNTNKVKLVTGNNTEPIDFLEGEGQGEFLNPVSLFEDQLNRRLQP